MFEQTIKYDDLVDVGNLQKLMDSLNQVMGIANAVIDIAGVVITRSGWQDVCVEFHRVNPQTCANCIASDTSLAKSIFKGEAFAIYDCLNGLVDSAMPIIVDGQHLANVFTGQCFTEPPSLEFFRQQAQQFGFDEQSYLQAVAKVPIIPKPRLEAITKMYAQLAQTLAANGMDRLRQQRATMELAKLNNELVLRVAERTEELSRKNLQLQQEKQALTDSEARLTALFENMGSGVAVYKPSADGDDFIFCNFNKAAEHIEKIRREELLGKKLTEVFPGINKFGLVEVLQRVNKTGQAETFPLSFYQDQRIAGWRDNYVYKLPTGEIVAIYDDVTEHKQAEKFMQLVQFSINCVSDSVYWIDPHARIQFVNDSACQLTGYSREKLFTLTVMDIDPNFSAQKWLSHWQELKQKKSFKFESAHLTVQGNEVPVEVVVNYIVFEGQEYNCAFVRDITERKAMQAELERQARIDYLTGIANRRHFMAQSEVELARALRYNSPLSLFMLDIDFFKKVNDSYGHKVGDEVLQKIGGIFRGILRENDIAGRLGGEEFAILLPETTGKQAGEVAERLRELIENTQIPLESGVSLHFTVSIGIAALVHQNTTLDDLLGFADEALYQAKETGRNKICWYVEL